MSKTPKTTAERQRLYRANRATAGEGEGERKIVSWVPSAVFLALDRLARKQGLPKRQVLEQLISEADNANLSACTTDEELDAYLGVCA